MTKAKVTIDIVDDVIPKELPKEILEQADKIIADKIKYDIKISAKELQLQAKTFLNQINKLIDQSEDFDKQMIGKIIEGKNDEITTYWKTKDKNFKKINLQQQYLLIYNFEKYLDIFRDAVERKMVYVETTKDEHIVGSHILDMRDLILSIDERGYFSETSLLGYKKIGNRKSDFLENDSQLLNERHVEEAKIAFEAIRNRLERYYELNNKTFTKDPKNKSKNYVKTYGILLWKEKNNTWQARRVINYGDVRESYVNFLFSHHESNLCKIIQKRPGNPLYYNHELVKEFFENYIKEVDSVGSLVHEDIVLNNAQYGIKSKGAHMPQINQYIRIAKSICEAKIENINQEWVEQEIKKIDNENKGERNVKAALKELTATELKHLKIDTEKSQVIYS